MKSWKPPEVTHGHAKDHAPAFCEGQTVAPATEWATGRNGGIKAFWPVSDPLQRYLFYNLKVYKSPLPPPKHQFCL